MNTMSLLELSLTVMAVSIPRLFSPSPLSVTAVLYGTKEGWRGGMKIACGHTVVALPIVIILGLGMTSFENLPLFKPILSMLGAFALFIFAGLKIYDALKKNNISYVPRYNAFLIGIILTALNPFFHVWWFTVGFKLLSDAFFLYSIIGILVVFISHIWIDYAWFAVIGLLSKKGNKLFLTKYSVVFTIVISSIFVYFAIVFLLQAIS